MLTTARDGQKEMTSPKQDQKLPSPSPVFMHTRVNSLRVRKSPIENDIKLTSQTSEEDFVEREEDLKVEGSSNKLFSPSCIQHQNHRVFRREPKLNSDLAQVTSYDSRKRSIETYQESGNAKEMQSKMNVLEDKFNRLTQAQHEILERRTYPDRDYPV